MIAHSDLEKIFNDCCNDDLVNSEKIDKAVFENYLDVILHKLKKSNNIEAEKQIIIIERMKRSLKRQQYILVNHSIQSKLINQMTIQIQQLEQNIDNLTNENENLKQILEL